MSRILIIYAFVRYIPINSEPHNTRTHFSQIIIKDQFNSVYIPHILYIYSQHIYGNEQRYYVNVKI